jgi:hypothetical protein
MLHGAFLIESGCYPKIKLAGQWKTMESWLGVPNMLGNLHISPIAMATKLVSFGATTLANIPHLWTTHITNRVFPKRYEPFEMVNYTSAVMVGASFLCTDPGENSRHLGLRTPDSQISTLLVATP